MTKQSFMVWVAQTLADQEALYRRSCSWTPVLWVDKKPNDDKASALREVLQNITALPDPIEAMINRRFRVCQKVATPCHSGVCPSMRWG